MTSSSPLASSSNTGNAFPRPRPDSSSLKAPLLQEDSRMAEEERVSERMSSHIIPHEEGTMTSSSPLASSSSTGDVSPSPLPDSSGLRKVNSNLSPPEIETTKKTVLGVVLAGPLNSLGGPPGGEKRLFEFSASPTASPTTSKETLPNFQRGRSALERVGLGAAEEEAERRFGDFWTPGGATVGGGGASAGPYTHPPPPPHLC